MNEIELSDRYAKWKALVDDQEKSGLSQSEFCKQHNLVLSKFGYYRGIVKSKNKADSTDSKLFNPVHIKKITATISTEIRIVLPNGFQCFIPSQVDISHVRRLVEALLSC